MLSTLLVEVLSSYPVGSERWRWLDDGRAHVDSRVEAPRATVSDLSRKRREVADVARRGLARIRDTDGTGLVLMPARRYEVLEAVSLWADRLGVVERTLTKSRAERTPADFGDLTWLRHFDEDDLAEFVSELRQTLSLAYHDDDLASLVDAVAEWKATSDELADPARREVLLGSVDAADFVEVARPERHR